MRIFAILTLHCVPFIFFSWNLSRLLCIDHAQKNSWNQLFSNFYSENVTFTKFLQKCVWDWVNLLSPKKISSNQLSSNFFSKNVTTFTKFLQKCVRLNSSNFHTVKGLQKKLRENDSRESEEWRRNSVKTMSFVS